MGIECKVYNLSDTITEKELLLLINTLNTNLKINGILIQLPLPHHLNNENIFKQISYIKDVDGFHAQNIGELALKNRNPTFISCTPLACLQLLKEYNIKIKGKHIVIIGNSNIVGLPLSLLLLKNEATVTICHKETTDIKLHTKNADIIISACGQAHMIKLDWVKENSIIIDIGINYIEDNTKKSGKRLVGDVDFDNIKNNVYAITPVPGGIGPLTIAILLSNTLYAFKLQNNFL